MCAAHEIFDIRKPANGADGPRAINTPFGWCIIGNTEKTTEADGTSGGTCFMTSSNAEVQLNDLVESFWKIESIGIKIVNQVSSQEDKTAMKILNETATLRDGRYQVGLMWEKANISVPNNRTSG